ncbi:MAG: MBL fold metallo-hydrolase RNA specificity domain-containing protein [Coraliomargarita sp.]
MLTPEYRGGLYLPTCDLWLDAPKRKPFAVVSHAHGDHVARHECFLATPATIDLIRVRMGESVAQRGVKLPFGETYQGKGFTVRLLPAGHVLGSAMVLIETEGGESLLYTGDFKTKQGLSAEALQLVRAETLIMETTFGRPNYVFPSTEDLRGRIRSFCSDTLSAGQTPVLLAYSLGKAQEVLKVLEGQGFSLMAHAKVRELNQVYSYHGIQMPDTRPLDFLNMAGQVVVMPPAVSKKLPKQNCQVAMVSGWGLDGSARYRYGVDTMLPLSDHADYPDLLHFVDQVSPAQVFTMHGYDQDFAADLRGRGYTAWSLKGRDQLELGF